MTSAWASPGPASLHAATFQHKTGAFGGSGGGRRRAAAAPPLRSTGVTSADCFVSQFERFKTDPAPKKRRAASRLFRLFLPASVFWNEPVAAGRSRRATVRFKVNSRRNIGRNTNHKIFINNNNNNNNNRENDTEKTTQHQNQGPEPEPETRDQGPGTRDQGLGTRD
ncbi:uncharacterized protein V6R79_017662 [Siganus canaliculatus]